MKRFKLFGFLAIVFALFCSFSFKQFSPPSCPPGYVFVYWNGGSEFNPSNYIVDPYGDPCFQGYYICGFCVPSYLVSFNGVLQIFPSYYDDPFYYTDGDIYDQIWDFIFLGNQHDQIFSRFTYP